MKVFIQKIKVIILMIMLISPFWGFAQKDTSKPKIEKIAKVAEEVAEVVPSVNPKPYISNKEVFLSYGVLVFALLVIILVLIGFSKRTDTYSTKDLTRTITSVVIITSVLFLITCGYSSEQIQPAIGLLGALAGYVLGQQSSNKSDT